MDNVIKITIGVVVLIVIFMAAFGLMVVKFYEEPAPESGTNNTVNNPPPGVNPPPPTEPPPVGITPTCDVLYRRIDGDIKAANFCVSDADCDVLMLGGEYVKFGCYHFVNKGIDKTFFYTAMDEYNKQCSTMINDCAPSPTPRCVLSKCVAK